MWKKYHVQIKYCTREKIIPKGLSENFASNIKQI